MASEHRDLHGRLTCVLLGCLIAACDRRSAIASVDGESRPEAPPTMVRCERADPSGPRCQGLPGNPWCRREDGFVCDASEDPVKEGSYPVGCTVTYKHVNPYYPGSGGQHCECMATPFDTGTGRPAVWACPV